MARVRSPHAWVWKKREKRSTLWALVNENYSQYHKEFLAIGYRKMVAKYHIARADLKKIFGSKPRPVKNIFYILINNPDTFERVKGEYYSKTSAQFVEKYRVGMRQARQLFGIKHINKVKHIESRTRPVEIERVRERAYWEDENYWKERGVE